MTDRDYLTLAREGQSRYEEKKSVFLGFAAKLESEDAAARWISSIKRAYPDARHHVYAYRLREGNSARYSDDREPQGTAGMPILDVLRGKDLLDCGIVVVRYFGGTLLGTGGLVRAYSAAASDAVKDAGIVRMTMRRRFALSLSYADNPRVSQILSSRPGVLYELSFGEGVTVSGTVDADAADALSLAVTDSTAGRVSPEWGELVFSPVPVDN